MLELTLEDGDCEELGLREILSDGLSETERLGLRETLTLGDRLGLRDGDKEMDKEGDDTSRASVTAYSLPYSNPYIGHSYSATCDKCGELSGHDYLKQINLIVTVPVGVRYLVQVIVNPSASNDLSVPV